MVRFAGFLRMGMLWAFAYLIVEAFLPGSMTGLEHDLWQKNTNQIIYYSISDTDHAWLWRDHAGATSSERLQEHEAKERTGDTARGPLSQPNYFVTFLKRGILIWPNASVSPTANTTEAKVIRNSNWVTLFTHPSDVT